MEFFLGDCHLHNAGRNGSWLWLWVWCDEDILGGRRTGLEVTPLFFSSGRWLVSGEMDEAEKKVAWESAGNSLAQTHLKR